MIVCIDTNIVLQALRFVHAYAPILEAWIHGKLTWAVSTDILLEYEEVITRMSGAARWRKLARLMDLAELTDDSALTGRPIAAHGSSPHGQGSNFRIRHESGEMDIDINAKRSGHATGSS